MRKLVIFSIFLLLVICCTLSCYPDDKSYESTTIEEAVEVDYEELLLEDIKIVREKIPNGDYIGAILLGEELKSRQISKNHENEIEQLINDAKDKLKRSSGNSCKFEIDEIDSGGYEDAFNFKEKYIIDGKIIYEAAFGYYRDTALYSSLFDIIETFEGEAPYAVTVKIREFYPLISDYSELALTTLPDIQYEGGGLVVDDYSNWIVPKEGQSYQLTDTVNVKILLLDKIKCGEDEFVIDDLVIMISIK